MSGERLFFIDNLRILLIVLVILLHLAITYGSPVGLWYYHEGQVGLVEGVFYALFQAVTQAFFMGFFFLIAGYFTPGSLDRKGTHTFLKDRVLRLGIPLILYILIVDPLIGYVLAISSGFTTSPGTFLNYYIAHYSALGSGPLWFVEALLIFAGIYVLWRKFAKTIKSSFNLPGDKTMVLFAFLLGISSFAVRIWSPIGSVFGPLNFQLGFFPQYIALFTVGIIAFRNNWFAKIPAKTGKIWTIVAVGLVPLLLVLAVVGAPDFDTSSLMGGATWQSFAYSMWEQFLAVAIIISLIVRFREKHNSQEKLAAILSADAYTTYILFAPIIVFLAISLKGIAFDPLLKFAVVSPLAVLLCFTISHLVRKLPHAKKIL